MISVACLALIWLQVTVNGDVEGLPRIARAVTQAWRRLTVEFVCRHAAGGVR